jgi:NTE family protein
VALRDLLRRVRRAPTAFVLSGGGNLGAIQVGQLKALVERGIVPDLVVGCSVGAINGAALARDPTVEGMAALERVWRSLDGRVIAPPFRLPLPVQLARRGRAALHPNDGVYRIVRDTLGDARFEQLRIPFQCVATSLDRRAPRWFSSGSLSDPLVASAAIPGVFPPVVIDGERLIDGAVVFDVPLQRAVDLGARHLFVLYTGNLDRPHPPARRPLDVALEASWIARANWYRLTLEAVSSTADVTVLPLGDTPVLRYDDFSHTPQLIDDAYALTAAFLDGRPMTAPPPPEEAVEEGQLLG